MGVEPAGLAGAQPGIDELIQFAVEKPVPKRSTQIEVAAGLVFREGKLLITRRPAGGHLAGLWEFPGGKRENSETFEECLRRELREELGIEVEVRELVESITHDYPEKTVHLRFYRCRWTQREPQPLGCPEFRWISAGQLERFQFPAADARLLEMLRRESGYWQP